MPPSSRKKNASKQGPIQQSLRDMFGRAKPSTTVPSDSSDAPSINHSTPRDQNSGPGTAPIAPVQQEGPSTASPCLSPEHPCKPTENSDSIEFHLPNEPSSQDDVIDLSSLNSPPSSSATLTELQSDPIHIDLTSPSPTVPKKVPHSRSMNSPDVSPISVMDIPPALNPKNPVRPPKLVHPLFHKVSTKHRKQDNTPWAPPPLTSETQHVSGPRTAFKARNHSLCRRPRTHSQNNASWSRPLKPTIPGSQPIHLPNLCGNLPSQSQRQDHLASLPSEFVAHHPVLTHMHHAAAHDDHALWTHKWRPTHASHVFGNEKNACFLRDWLKAQSLVLDANGATISPVKKPSRSSNLIKRKRATGLVPIIRQVTKKRKRRQIIDSDDDEHDWIVDSDEPLEEDTLGSGDDEDESSFLSTERGAASTTTTRFSRLTNTILLHGPVGTGKTAAVYACAEELGWDVFEVYPGIGRRNASSIDSLVGEVGRNHMVGKSSLYRGSETGKDFSYLQSSPNGMSEGLQEAINRSSLLGFLENTPLDEPTSVHVRQSVILLEEVDILYKEDQNFWPAVVKMIKDCKRPVVCTCNDIGLVPLDDLPLQAKLTFLPPAEDAASRFLESICFLEGIQTDLKSILYLYSQMDHDIRRTLCCLQFSPRLASLPCHPHTPQPTWDPRQKPEPYSLPDYIENLSFLDSVGGGDDFAISSDADSIDEQIGYAVLRDTQNALQSSQTIHEDYGKLDHPLFFGGESHTVGDSSYHRTLQMQLKTLALHNDVFPSQTAAAMPEEFYLEYLPMVRKMIKLDDEQEFLLRGDNPRLTTRSRVRRATRSNQGYVRTVTLSEQDRTILETTDLTTGS